MFRIRLGGEEEEERVEDRGRQTLMDGGSEGQAKGNERRQGQPRRHETHCRRLAKEHDEAARSAQQRRAGSRFRYRRRRQAAPYLRLAQDAPFHVIFFAALWTTLVGAGALATIGTIALGNDTESDRISVRTAVDAESPGSRVPSNSSFSTYQLHSAALLDLITTTDNRIRGGGGGTRIQCCFLLAFALLGWPNCMLPKRQAFGSVFSMYFSRM